MDLTKILDMLRGRRKSAAERLVALAREVAAGKNVDLASLDEAVQATARTPDQFKGMVGRATERRRLAELIATRPKVEERLAEIEQQITQADAELTAAEERHAGITYPLVIERDSLRTQSLEISTARGRLPGIVIDEEVAKQRAEIFRAWHRAGDEMRRLEGEIRYQQGVEKTLKARATELGPNEVKGQVAARDAVSYGRRVINLQRDYDEAKGQFDALTQQLETLDAKLAAV